MVKTTNWLDKSTGDVFSHTEQDMSPILDLNKEHRKEFAVERNSSTGKFKEWCKVASIPNIVVDDLMRKGIWNDRKRFKKWLNQVANKPFRTVDSWL